MRWTKLFTDNQKAKLQGMQVIFKVRDTLFARCFEIRIPNNTKSSTLANID